MLLQLQSLGRNPTCLCDTEDVNFIMHGSEDRDTEVQGGFWGRRQVECQRQKNAWCVLAQSPQPALDVVPKGRLESHGRRLER